VEQVVEVVALAQVVVAELEAIVVMLRAKTLEEALVLNLLLLA
jgi:hypothetical protein